MYIQQFRFDDAERVCRDALALDPNFDEAYFNLGGTLKLQQRSDEAIAAYKMAVQISPDYSIAYRELGAALLDKGENREAERYIRASLDIDPHDRAAIELQKLLNRHVRGNRKGMGEI